MTITAKYRGQCRICQGTVLPGQQINWEPGEKPAHVVCPPVSAQPEVRRGPVVIPITAPLPEQGTFTVVLGDVRRTLRLQKGRMGSFAGKTIVKFLSGTDNERNYTAFGHIEDGNVRIWRRFQPDSTIIECLKFLVAATPEQMVESGERYAIESSNCYRCGRTLTVPTSIHRGLGPECAQIMEVVA